ncbi:MAG: hypothetical protein PHN88_05115 [Ignavibacteria bacterium]|nr:hypothetical protein [Ignavibacteria bacterium]
MKKLLLVIVLIFFISPGAFAQFGDILKKATEKVTKVDLLEEKNVTTSIEDALPVAFWLKDIDEYYEPTEPETNDFNLDPGYYRFYVQSYCLKAGTHGPSKGSGYLLAPLKGKRSDLVYNIVARSSNFPEIEQHDIQLLLWGIIAGSKFTDFDISFQNKVRPLMTTAEIAEFSLDLKNVPIEVMPDDIKQIAQFYKDFRARLTNPNITYNEVESMAMVNGVLPEDPFSKYVEKGLWAYLGDGFYGRGMPQSYPRTIFEVYRPVKINSTRDSKGRLSVLENDGNKIEIIYDDEQGRDVISFGSNGDYPIWRIKSIKLTGTNPGEEYSLDNSGWMIKDKGLKIKTSGQGLKDGVAGDDPAYGDYTFRMNNGKNALKNYDDYMNEKKMKPLKDKQDEYWADYNTMEGLKVATNPLNKKGQMGWIEKNLKMVTEWWNTASSSLAGEESPDNGKKKVDIRKTPAVPATNGMQRIISSERRYKNE